MAVVAPSEKVDVALQNLMKNDVDITTSGGLGEGIRFCNMDSDPILKMTA